MSQRDPSNSNEHPALGELERAQKLIAQLPDDSAKQQNLAAMGLLAAFVAHECRNRLTPIVGYARAASKSPGDRELVQKAMARIGESARDLANLSEMILDSVSPAHSDGSVAQAWDFACKEVSELLDSSGIVVSSEIEPSLVSRMSQVAMSHVFENLLRNAVASGSPGSEIALVGRSTGNGQTIDLKVQDSARGMEKETTETACYPLVSGSGSTGLGLALCKFLVESVGGRFQVQSEKGNGTIINIRLPSGNKREAASITPAEEAKHPQD